MPAHTTLPPLSARRSPRPIDGEYDCAIVTNLDGRPAIVAECFGRLAEDIRMDAEANARMFVNAVNAHADLIEALNGARSIVEKWCHYQGSTPELFAEYLGPIDAALDKAEGRS